MKLLRLCSSICICDGPFIASDQLQKTDVPIDESLFFCNLTDVIKKYENWIKLMPKVKPYYGKILFLY